MTKYIAPLGLAVLLLTGCGSSKPAAPPVAPASSEAPPAIAPSAETAPTTEAAPPVEEVAAEVVAVDAAQLLLDFDGNEAAADMKYAGKILEVTGNVDKVDTEFLDDTQYVVQLDDGSEYSFLRVNCNDVSADQAAAVVPASTVTVRGTFGDGGNLGIQIKDCVVL